MRGGTRSRPASQHGPQTPYAQVNRKIFNCIVDDTALVAGVKRSTRNGIRQWVKNSQIRLFVPLHALDQLSRQKSAATKHGEDVRETLEWLDDATTKYPHAVTLQGGDQYYANWTDVERFAVPRTLFSELDHEMADNQDAPTADLSELSMANMSINNQPVKSAVSSAASVGSGPASSMQSVRSSVSPVSPPTSPAKVDVAPAKSMAAAMSAAGPSSTASGSIPGRLQPLFNYCLWRIHQELDPAAALETFIFLCNDPPKVHYAKGFDIKSKRLEQLREAVGREDRDIRNRMSFQHRENQQTATPVSTAKDVEAQIDDEVVFKPTPRAPVTEQQLPANVIDPNAFGRTPVPIMMQTPPKSPRFTTANMHRGGSGFSPRGSFRGHNFRGVRGGRGNGARGGFQPQAHAAAVVDPDSFERPRGGPALARGSRKLWVPT